MSYLGRISGKCENKTGFTGKEKCDVQEAIPRMLFLSPRGTEFPLDKDEFNQDLQKYINEGKLIPVSDLADATPEGGDAATAQAGSYGPSKVTGINAYVRTFLVDGGDCMFKSLKDLQGLWDVFVLDDNMNLRGYAKQKGESEVFLGHDADVFVTENEPNGGSVYTIVVRVAYGVNYDNQRKNRHTINIDVMPEGIVGVILEKVSTGVVKVVSQCGGTDFTELFNGNITPEMFVDKTGKAVTTATYDGETKTITLAPTTSPVRVAGADVLSAGNVLGIGGVNQYVDIK